MIIYLFGGYRREFGPLGHMRFLTLRGARNYGTGWLSSIDPYVRVMSDEITPIRGKWARRGGAK